MNWPNSLRIKALIDLLKKMKLDACLIENPVDLFYLTNCSVSLGTLIVTRGKSRFFVDGRYLLACKEKAPRNTSLTDEKTIQAFLREQKVKTLAFDSDATSYKRYSDLKEWASLKPLPAPLKFLRVTKDAEEQKALKKSASLLFKIFLKLPKLLKEGITEKELATRFEILALEMGADKLSFEPIIAFGKNCANPHYHPSKSCKLKKRDPIMVDIGVELNGYQSDMTRMLFFKEPTAAMKRLYSIVTEAQKAALLLCKPGVVLGALDEAARKIFKREKMEQYYPHSLGHGVGLEVHEFPRISFKGIDKETLIQPSMCITVEPGLYVPNVGGVRYEDTILITKTGYQNLYPRLELEDVIVP